MKKILVIAAAGMVAVSGCSSHTGTVAANVGGYKITQQEIKFYEENYGKSSQSGEDAVQTAIDNAVNDRIVIELAKKQNIKLSAEDEQSVTSQMVTLRRKQGTTTEFNQYLKENSLTEDFVKDTAKAQILREKLISEDEKQQYFKDHYYRAKHILILTTDETTGQPMDDAAKAEAKAKAEELLKKAQSGEDFDTLMNENSQDPGSKSNPDGYVFTDGEMVTEFQEAVENCEIGGFALCESSFGYHVIHRLALDETPELFDKEYKKVETAIAETFIDDGFDDKLNDMASENKINVEKNDANIEQIKNALKDDTSKSSK